MDWRFLLEFLDYFVHSVVYYVYSALLATWDDVVRFAWEGVDVVCVDLLDFVLKGTYSEVPYPDLFVLACAQAYLVIFKCNILNPIMSFQDEERLDDITLRNRANFPFGDRRTLNIKKLKLIPWSTDQPGQGGSKPKGIVMIKGRTGHQGNLWNINRISKHHNMLLGRLILIWSPKINIISITFGCQQLPIDRGRPYNRNFSRMADNLFNFNIRMFLSSIIIKYRFELRD